MRLYAALTRLARESVSALLIALVLISSVAQARQLAAYGQKHASNAPFALCAPMETGKDSPADTIPPSGPEHGCMQCCLALSSVLPVQYAIGLLAQWRAETVPFSTQAAVQTPLFLAKEARGPPVMRRLISIPSHH